ncbi:MAG: L-2-amino-thiazoline-4-carboxylic acid hydrolase [Candidatus Aminicenantes bacterium]|nr:L-2-amino-thiazoline-4-carboxylic acid hydrolase [Candidatus Aminicenantes bacterium]
MKEKTTSPSFNSSRREFLKNILPAGAIFCFGCSNLFGVPQTNDTPTTSTGKHKFLEDAGLNYEEIFALMFQYYYIPVMKQMAGQVGKEKFLEQLKNASSEATAASIGNMAKSFPTTDLTMMAMVYKTNPLFQHSLTYETVENTSRVLELKVHECLWAKTFREVDAADIGYAAICYADYAMAEAFNPKIKMIRSKTLMQGHDYCNHRYVMEE